MVSRGKLTKYKVLKGDSTLITALPKTNSYSDKNLGDYLSKYSKVIVKPSFGSGGVGVKKITALGNDRYEIHTGARKRTITGK
ncbi:MAG: YheC/YheD family protein, partial [Bacilli bacterium]